MAERHALHGREARESEEIGKRVHPDILVEEYIELEPRDRGPRGVQARGKLRPAIAVGANDVRGFVFPDLRREERNDLEPLPREPREKATRGLADAVIVKVPRDESD